MKLRRKASGMGKCIKTNGTWIGSIILASFIILAQYELPLMSYGLVAMILYCVGTFVFNGGCAYINKPMCWFIIFCMIEQLLLYWITGTFSLNRNTYFFMVICFFILVFACSIELNSFIKIYYWIGIACCCLVIYQFFMGNILGIPQNAIQLLPVSPENQHYWLKNSARVSGVFTEPQGFCSYILPLLVYLVFQRKVLSALFVSITIFLSSSSQGIILAVIIWSYYLIVYEKKLVKRFLRIFLFAGLGGIGALILSRSGTFSYIIEKIMSINIFAYDIRLTKGFQIYAQMPILDKITGIGFGNLRAYLNNGQFHFFWMNLTRPELFDYITTMSNILVSYGLVGTFFYLRIFAKNVASSNSMAKVMLLLIFISSFTQTILFNSWFVYYWVVYEVFDDLSNDNYYRIKLV